MCHIPLTEPLRQERQTPAQRWTQAFFAVVFFGLPLVMWYGFFAVTEAKAVFFTGAAVLYLLGMALLRFGRHSATQPHAPFPVPDLAMAAFLLMFSLSALLDKAPASGLIAADNRYQSVVTVVLYASVFFVASRNSGALPIALFGLALGFLLSTLLGVLNYFQLDPLGTLAPLSDFDAGRYLSTLGNINFFGSYIALLLPIFCYFACCAPRRTARLVCLLLAVVGVMAAMTARSESTVLSLGVALLLTPLLLPENELSRFPAVLLTLAAAMGVMSLLQKLTGAPAFSKLTALLLRPAVGCSVISALAILFVLFRRAPAMRLVKLRRAYAIALCGCAVAVLIGTILLNTVFSTEKLPDSLSLLRFEDHWGTDRGAIWRFCMETFSDFSPWQKLIGGGPGCVARADAVSPLFADAITDSAHNEYLQYLLTIGVMGLLSYLSLLVFTARESLRYDRSPLSNALLLGAAAYAVGAVVNIAQPVSTPLFFLVLTLLHGRAQQNKKWAPMS